MPGRADSGGRFDSDLSARRYYQALAQRKLGEDAQADAALKHLLEAAEADLERRATTGGNERMGRRSRRAGPALSHYLAGLAHLGLGQKEAAREQFTAALAASPDLLGAKAALDGLR